MSRLRLLVRTLWYFRLGDLAVVLSVAVGAAVLTGSLVIGDSVRDSLARIVERRLGKVDHVLLAPDFFQESLAARLGESPSFSDGFSGVEPMVVTSASATDPGSGAVATRVNVFGRAAMAPRTCTVSEKLAERLNVGAGGTIVLRMDPLKHVAAYLPVGAGRGEIALLRLKVARVAEKGGFEDAFSFYGTQRPVPNVWVPLAELQRALDVPGRANALLASAEDGYRGEAGARTLQELTGGAVSLEDYGLRLVESTGGRFFLESRQLLISRALERDIRRGFPDATPVFAYVANAVRDLDGGKEFPYSMVAGLNELPDGPVGKGRIVLNEWAAADLGAEPGDRIELSCVVHPSGGLPEERSTAFVLDRVIETSGIGADRALVPEFKGVTDADSLATWKPPRDFEFHPERIRQKDEDYWKLFGPAPKAFVDIGTAQELWGTAFGALTSFMFRGGAQRDLRRGLLNALEPGSAGLAWRPVRHEQLRSAGGGTDFGQLFMGFSFFLVVSSALLVLLTMRLSVEQRTRQIGVMFATGFTEGSIRRLLLAEGALLLAAGCVLGAAGSAAYARLMLAGLKTVWNEAVGTSLLRLSLDGSTILIGGGLSFAVGGFAIWRGVARVGRMRVAGALSGRRPGEDARPAGRRGGMVLAAGMFAAAGAVVLAALLTDRLNTTAAFFAGGVGLLCASVAALRAWLAGRSRGATPPPPRMALAGLAARNAARNPHRSLLAAGLLASAAFVTVAVSSMKGGTPDAAPGGYTLVAEFDVPIPYDMNRAEARELLALGGDDELWKGVRFVSMRTSPGEDASCRNLYRPTNPRVTSVPGVLREEGAFPFASSVADVENPWILLDAPQPDGAIPAVLDYEAARWIVHKNVGETLAVTDERGVKRKLRIVALLKKSIFQAEVLLSEDGFQELFPSRSGYGQLLVATRPEEAERVKNILTRGLADFGATVETTAERMSSFTRIADSYISAFGALGGLGLVLGSLGLVVVLIRGTVERRAELALLSALGFGRARLAFLISFENAFLLLVGMLAGTVSALVAIAPEFVRSGGRLGSVGVALGLFCGVVAGMTALLICVSASLVRRLTPASLRLE